MGEYDQALLARLGQREAELGPRGSEPLPRGLYHVTTSAEASETLTDGPPVLQSAFKVIQPETVMSGDTEVKVAGRIVSNRSWWFSKEDDTKEQSLEVRQAFTRKLSEQWLTGFMYQLYGAGCDDDADSLSEAIATMHTDDEELVAEMMDAITGILDGHDFFLQVSVRVTDDATFNNIRPFIYTKNKRGEEAVQYLLESYDRGAEKMGIVSEEALASI